MRDGFRGVTRDVFNVVTGDGLVMVLEMGFVL